MLADVVTETSAVRKELTRTHLLIHALVSGSWFLTLRSFGGL